MPTTIGSSGLFVTAAIASQSPRSIRRRSPMPQPRTYTQCSSSSRITCNASSPARIRKIFRFAFAALAMCFRHPYGRPLCRSPAAARVRPAFISLPLSQRSPVRRGDPLVYRRRLQYHEYSGVAADRHSPVPYGITCISGNSVSVPYFIASAALDSQPNGFPLADVVSFSGASLWEERRMKPGTPALFYSSQSSPRSSAPQRKGKRPLAPPRSSVIPPVSHSFSIR